jgi:hypothetical protein
MSGNFDLLRMSLPVKLFEPRSYLQKLTDPWVFPRLLDRAAACAGDPRERLRWAAAYCVAGYHRAFIHWAKPFNPILGETWQASLPDGTRIWLEQASHHPPVTAFQMSGPRGAYSFHGASAPAVAYKANSIRTQARGQRRLEFADGGAIDVAFPHFTIRGLVSLAAAPAPPRAEVGGTVELEDRANGLLVVVRFGRVEGAPAGSLAARVDGLAGTMYRTTVPHPPSPAATGSPQAPAPPGGLHRAKSSGASLARLARAFGSGGMRPVASSAALGAAAAPAPHQARVPIAACTGNWLSHLDWEGERYWTLAEEEPAEWVPDPDPLPSDVRFRADLADLARGDLAAAQQSKEELEARQRLEAKLRKEGGGATA